MKSVILAGGLGSRINEETNLKPKPMIEIGGRPNAVKLSRSLSGPKRFYWLRLRSASDLSCREALNLTALVEDPFYGTS